MKYLNPKFDSCEPDFLVSTKESLRNFKAELSYDANTGVLTIKNAPSGKLQFLDISGKVIFEKAMGEGIRKLKLPANATYFIAVLSDDQGRIVLSRKLLSGKLRIR